MPTESNFVFRCLFIPLNYFSRFSVHRLVMAVASKLFQAQIDGGKDEIVLKGLYGTTLKKIIEYCYTGRIAISKENVNGFIAIASNLDLIELEQRCREFWEINLSGNNAVTNLLNAEKYNLKDLRQKALKRIRADFEEIPIDELLQIDGPVFQERNEFGEKDKIGTYPCWGVCFFQWVMIRVIGWLDISINCYLNDCNFFSC